MYCPPAGERCVAAILCPPWGVAGEEVESHMGPIGGQGLGLRLPWGSPGDTCHTQARCRRPDG